MKYKYIVGLFVALSLNNAFAADELYQGVYETLTSERLTASQRISGALDENQTYDNKKDGNLCRSILAGFQLRKAVFELKATELQTIVEANNAFFKTSLGMSLVYGWTLQHFAAPELPYYIVGNFSFVQHFNLITEKFTNEETKIFLKSAFAAGLAAVNADQDTLWEFYSDAISALCVVESISSRDGDLSMDGIIEGSYLTKAKPAQSVPTIVINDTKSLDDIDHASYLETALDESIVRTYYDEIKDQFSGEFVSGENMIKLQHLVDLIEVGTADESGVLRSIEVEENTVFSLNAKLVGNSGNILNFSDEHELKTLRELCNYLLGKYTKEQEDKAVEEEKQKRKHQEKIRTYDELYQVASTFRVGNVVPDNIKSIQYFAELLKEVPEMKLKNHARLMLLTAGMSLDGGKSAQKEERKSRKAALTEFVSKMKTIPEKFKTGETAYTK